MGLWWNYEIYDKFYKEYGYECAYDDNGHILCVSDDCVFGCDGGGVFNIDDSGDYT